MLTLYINWFYVLKGNTVYTIFLPIILTNVIISNSIFHIFFCLLEDLCGATVRIKKHSKIIFKFVMLKADVNDSLISFELLTVFFIFCIQSY